MDNRKLQILGRDDQWVVAICLVIFFLVIGFYFWHRNVVNGGLIDFEDMPGRHASYQVDINHANWQQFANLPGIGEKLAKEIVQHRELQGPFKHPDQLIEIAGIGEVKLAGMRNYLALVDERPVDPGK